MKWKLKHKKQNHLESGKRTHTGHFIRYTWSATPVQYVNDKGFYIAIFYSTWVEQKQQHAFLSNIHTLLDASESNSGFIILSNLACRLEQLWIKPKTLQLVDDLLYLLSYSHSINVDNTTS